MSDSAPKSSNQSSGAVSIPAKIGRYEILDKVGSGRMGTVYRATDPFIGRFLAIKTFRVDLPSGPQRDRFLQRFFHEARISGGLAHPNIVTLFDVGELDGLPYLVFEHVEGPTLEVAIARVGRLDPVETIRIVEQAATALDFAHTHGVVHRDIRPPNIILGNDKRVRVADFGIARVEGSQLTQLGEILGTPAYMSPEQVRGHELTAESDLFSLAICAYEMLSGHRPFVGNTQAELLDAIVYAPPTEPKALRALGIPSRDFMFVFERALAKDPSHRFADGASFARALKSCLGMVVTDDEPPLVAKIAVPEFKPKPAAVPAPSAPIPPPAVAPSSRLIGVVAPPARPSGLEGLSSPGPADLVVGPTGNIAISAADATMLGSAEDDDLPETIRLPRLPASSFTPKAETELPPTRDMERPSVSALQPAPSTSGSVTLAGPPLSSRTASKVEPVAKSEDKTMVISEPASVAVGKMPPRADGRGNSEDPTMVRPESASPVTAKPRTSPEPPAKSEDKTMVMPESERAAVARAGALSATVADTHGRKALPDPTQSPADKTMVMTDSEKAAAARMKPTDRSPSRPAQPAGPPKPAMPPYAPMKTGAVQRPANLPSPLSTAPPPPSLRTGAIQRPGSQPSAPPAPFLLPPPVEEPSAGRRILLALLVVGALVALILGGVMYNRAGTAGSSASQEKWNDLPVYLEQDVTKSPLGYSQEMPKPKMEPGHVVSVTLSWIVTPDGRVDDPKIIESAAKEIDELMLEAVRKWRYEPAEKDGKTVPVRVKRKYTFGQRASEGS